MMSFNHFFKISRPLLRNSTRNYSNSQAAPKVDLGNPAAQSKTQVSKLRNGLTIASLSDSSPLARVRVYINAGARYAPATTPGFTQILRICSGQTTSKQNPFIITKKTELMGGAFDVTSNKEHMIYAADGLGGEPVNTYLNLISESVFLLKMKFWEIEEQNYRVHYELGNLNSQPQIVLMEKLLECCFRRTLGQPSYSPSYIVGTLDSHDILDYMQSHYTTGNMIVAASGVEHDYLVNFMDSLKYSREGGAAEKLPAKYTGGGDARVQNSSEVVQSVIAVEGAPLHSRDLVVTAVAQQLLAPNPSIKWADSVSTNKLQQAASQAAKSPCSVTSFLPSYSDAGLFAINVVGMANEMDPIMKAVASKFREVANTSFSDADIERAKNQVKYKLLISSESKDETLEDFALQIFNTGKYSNANEVCSQIDTITKQDITNVIKQLLSSRPTVAAIGNLYNTPYASEL